MTVWTTGFECLGHSLTFPRYVGWPAMANRRRASEPLAGAGRMCGRGAGGHHGSMTDRTYRMTEIVGTSPESVQQAIRNGVHRAGETVRHLDWFEVSQIRGTVEDGEIGHFQVQMKVGFRLEDT